MLCKEPVTKSQQIAVESDVVRYLWKESESINVGEFLDKMVKKKKKSGRRWGLDCLLSVLVFAPFPETKNGNYPHVLGVIYTKKTVNTNEGVTFKKDLSP